MLKPREGQGHAVALDQPVALALLAVLVAALVGLLVADRRGSRRGAWLTKPVASLAFVLLALDLGALATPYGQAVLVALGLSLVGDALLIPDDPRVFEAGIGAFFLAHVAFLAAFAVHGIRWPVAGVAALVLLPTAYLVGRRLLPHVEDELRRPVVVYMLVVSFLVILAAGTVAAGAPPVILVAALLFYASDLLVARDRFVHEAFVNRLVGLPLYYAAQVAFAWSVALLR